MSLFYSPVETLGSTAKTFREQALVAVKTNGSVGFEAVLRVERARSSTLQETPRHFGGRPTLAGSTISLHTGHPNFQVKINRSGEYVVGEPARASLL